MQKETESFTFEKSKNSGVKNRNFGKMKRWNPAVFLPPEIDTKPCKMPGGVID